MSSRETPYTLQHQTNKMNLKTIFALFCLPIICSSFATPKAAKLRLKTQIYTNNLLPDGMGDDIYDDLYGNFKIFFRKFTSAEIRYFVRAASLKNTIFSEGYLRQDEATDAVLSPAVTGMMNSYRLTSKGVTPGEVVVVYAPSNNGKTFAAEYLFHGNHGLRPERALKFSAVNMDDFEKQFPTRFFGRNELSLELHSFLLDSVTSPVEEGDKNGVPQAIVKNLQSVSKTKIDWFYLLKDANSFDEEKAIESSRPLPILYQENEMRPKHHPVLIIDDFNNDTKENVQFLRKLYTDASKARVQVFILTKNREFATKMVKLNGGSKILPLAGCVDNTDYKDGRTFYGKPIWNEMPWSIDNFRDLISVVVEPHNEKAVEDAQVTNREVLEALECLKPVPQPKPPNLFRRLYMLLPFTKKPIPPSPKPAKPSEVLKEALEYLASKITNVWQQ